MESLQPVAKTFRCPNSQKRDPRDSDKGSDDDSTDGEDSDIDLGEDSDDGEDWKLHNQSHDWDDFYPLFWDSSWYSPILLLLLDQLFCWWIWMNFVYLISEWNKYLWWELRLITNHDHKSVFMRHFSHNKHVLVN